MKFCKQCGEQLNAHANFCKSCGAALSSPTAHESVIHPEIRKPRKPVNKKKLFIILSTSLIVLLAISIGGYFFAETHYGETAQLEKLRSAIENKDHVILEDLLTAENITPDYYERFAAYFNEHPEQLDQFISELETEMTENKDAAYFIEIVETEKLLFLFPQYHYAIQPVTVNASANFEKTRITISDLESHEIEEPGETLEVTLLPGAYDVTFTHDQIYGEFSETIALDFWKSNTNELNAEVSFDGNMVQISSNYPKASLLINNEKQDNTIENTPHYGPMTYDESTSFQAVLEYPWDTYYSKEVMVSDASQDTVQLDFDSIQDQIKSDVYERIDQHTYEWVQAYRNKSINELTVMRNQAYLEKTEANFIRMTNEDSNFDGDIERIRIDDSSFNFSEDTDTYQAHVIAELQFHSGYYETGHRDQLNRSRDQYYWRYTFEFDANDNNWFITDSEEVSDFETTNIITY